MRRTSHDLVLMCETCGRFSPAPIEPEMPGFQFSGVIVCTDCGESAVMVRVSHGLGHTERGRIVVSDYDLPSS